MARRGFLLGAMLAVLVLPGTAAAHVTVAPRRLVPGAEELLVFSAPNERDRVPVTVLSVTLPPGFLIGSVETKPGWVATARTRTVKWRGGRIPPGQFAQFSVRAVAPDRTGRFATTAVEGFADRRESTFHSLVTVQPSSAAARTGRDAGARTLGKYALGAALVGILVAVAAGFLALRNWLSLPDPREGKESGEAPRRKPAGTQPLP